MVYAFDDADEDQGLQHELGEEEGEREEGEEVEVELENRGDEEDDEVEEGEYDYDDDSDKIDYDSEGGAFHYTEHHNCPVHHLLPSDVSYSPFYQEPEGDFSDGLDESDDADADADTGASLNDYPFPQPIANDVDMEDPADVDSHGQPTWAEDMGSDSESALDPDSDTAAEAQAVAIAMGTVPFAPTTTFTSITWEQAPPGATWTHTFSISNPNPSTIGPSNYGLVDFLRDWARRSRILQSMSRGSCPWPNQVNALQSLPETTIKYADLEGDQCDLQGISWDSLGVTRRDARERRLLTYSNYVNVTSSDRWTVSTPVSLVSFLFPILFEGIVKLIHVTARSPRCCSPTSGQLLSVPTYEHQEEHPPRPFSTTERICEHVEVPRFLPRHRCHPTIQPDVWPQPRCDKIERCARLSGIHPGRRPRCLSRRWFWRRVHASPLGF